MSKETHYYYYYDRHIAVFLRVTLELRNYEGHEVESLHLILRRCNNRHRYNESISCTGQKCQTFYNKK